MLLDYTVLSLHHEAWPVLSLLLDHQPCGVGFSGLHPVVMLLYMWWNRTLLICRCQSEIDNIHQFPLLPSHSCFPLKNITSNIKPDHSFKPNLKLTHPIHEQHMKIKQARCGCLKLTMLNWTEDIDSYLFVFGSLITIQSVISPHFSKCARRLFSSVS